jgi:hypothetical protein
MRLEKAYLSRACSLCPLLATAGNCFVSVITRFLESYCCYGFQLLVYNQARANAPEPENPSAGDRLVCSVSGITLSA